MTDPVADMINRIKNAQAVSKETVKIPYSKLKYEIVKILEKRGWIERAERKGKIPSKVIEIKLKYDNKRPVVSKARRVSKPGQRIYKSYNEIRRVREGRGMLIISTSKGLMTDSQARREKQGGELLFEIW